MNIRVEANAAGVRRAQAALRKVAEPGSFVTLFTRIGVTVLRWVDENFASGGARVGGWLPLRPLTIFGRRQGSAVPLSNTRKLRAAFTFQATEGDCRVGAAGQLGWIAKWQSEGTRRYDIYPRNKKVLAFPAPPQGVYSMGVGFYAKRVVIGKKGAATPRATGIPRVGIATVGQIKGMGYKVPGGKGPIQSFAVLQHVHHPGLPSRRILPTVEEAAPIVNEVVQDFLREQGLVPG